MGGEGHEDRGGGDPGKMVLEPIRAEGAGMIRENRHARAVGHHADRRGDRICRPAAAKMPGEIASSVTKCKDGFGKARIALRSAGDFRSRTKVVPPEQHPDLGTAAGPFCRNGEEGSSKLDEERGCGGDQRSCCTSQLLFRTWKDRRAAGRCRKGGSVHEGGSRSLTT